jgi:anion-transporting  ArsA/GET3 family ATPase
MIQFTTDFNRLRISKELETLNKHLQIVQRILADGGEATLERAAEYQTKGADYERKQAMQEVEKYILSLKYVPAFEKSRIRQAAWREQKNEYIDRLASALRGVSLNFATEVTTDAEGNWVAAPAIVEDLKQKYLTTLTPEDEEELELFKRFMSLFKELDEKGYTWRDRNGNDIYSVYFNFDGLTDTEIAQSIYDNKRR